MDIKTKLILQSIVRLLDEATGSPQDGSWRARAEQIGPDDESALRILVLALSLKIPAAQEAHEAVSERLAGTHSPTASHLNKGSALWKKPFLQDSEKKAIESAAVNYFQQMAQFPSQIPEVRGALEQRELAGRLSAASVVDKWLSSMRQLSTDLKTILKKAG